MHPAHNACMWIHDSVYSRISDLGGGIKDFGGEPDWANIFLDEVSTLNIHFLPIIKNSWRLFATRDVRVSSTVLRTKI